MKSFEIFILKANLFGHKIQALETWHCINKPVESINILINVTLS